MSRIFRALSVLPLLVALAACPAMGDAGQRLCPGAFSCADLVESSCGSDDQCVDSGSCSAALDLAEAGDDGVCRSAWCDLGESYRSCR